MVVVAQRQVVLVVLHNLGQGLECGCRVSSSQQATVIERLLYTADDTFNVPMLIVPLDRAHLEVNPVLPLKLVLKAVHVELYLL